MADGAPGMSASSRPAANRGSLLFPKDRHDTTQGILTGAKTALACHGAALRMWFRPQASCSQTAQRADCRPARRTGSLANHFLVSHKLLFHKIRANTGIHSYFLLHPSLSSKLTSSFMS